MIEQDRNSEVVETSLICALSVAVAAIGFFLGWLISMLTGCVRV
jgi:hypothetical protein